MAADTRRERVDKAMRARLMSGTPSPDEPLSEERLAEQYGVSRTPVREDLARLVSDGLVERRDQGLYPYRPRFDDLADLYELRTTLELRGNRRALDGETARHDPDVLGPDLDRWYEIREDPPDPETGIASLLQDFDMTRAA